MKKLITSLKPAGEILFIILILPYFAYCIHKTSYLPSQNFQFVVLQYIRATAEELMRIEKGFPRKVLTLLVTTTLLFLRNYIAEMHILLRIRDKKRK